MTNLSKKLIPFLLITLTSLHLFSEDTQRKTSLSINMKLIYADTKADVNINGSSTREITDPTKISQEIKDLKQDLSEELLKIYTMTEDKRKVEVVPDKPNYVVLQVKCQTILKQNEEKPKSVFQEHLKPLYENEK